MVQRIVNVEARADLRSSIMIQDTDSHCPRGDLPSQNTSAKMQTQDSTAKESKPEKSKPKEKKLANGKTSALYRFDNAVKPNCQEKKKKY